MKLTKKVLSVILAVMMVVTMLPMSVFAAVNNSSSDAQATNLKATIAAYEKKMNGKLYTNMAAGYSAYVAAAKAYDAYVYGDANISLKDYADDLSDAMLAMKIWEVTKTFTSKIGTWPANGANWTTDEVYKNIAWCGAADADVIGLTKSNTTLWARYSPSTMIYDGITAPKMPVMVVVHGDSGKNRYVYSVALTDDDGNSLKLVDDAWLGKANSGNNWDYPYQRWDSTAGQKRFGTSSQSSSYAAQVSAYSGWAWNNWSHDEGGTNVLTYDTEFPAGVYYKEITPTLTAYMGSNTTFTNSDIVNGGASNSSIAVVNYKAYLDAISNNTAKLNMIHDSLSDPSYLEGGAAELINAYDTASKFDLTSYFTSSNDYVGCANAIKSIVDNLNNSTNTADNDGYSALRAAITSSKSTYNSTSYQNYTEDSWAAFTAAYDSAKASMASVLTNGYTDSSAQAKADALIEALTNLQLVTTPANTTIIENTIDDADIAIAKKACFTTASYKAANLETLVAQAKAEIWGSVASYKDAASKVDERQQDMVDAWVVTIGEAIASLYISKDTISGIARSYSMNSAIAEAESKVPGDYSNYSDLMTVVEKAKLFDTKLISDTTDTSSFQTGIVDGRLQEYYQEVKKVIDAIDNLHLAFSKLVNGTIANSNLSTFSLPLSSNSATYYNLTYYYPNNTVIFRTNHDAATLPLNEAIIAYSETTTNESKCGWGFLDSINIDSNITSQTKELSSNNDDNDHSIDPTNYQGNLKTQASNGYVYQLGKVSGIDKSGIFGAQNSQSDYIALDAKKNPVFLYTTDLTDYLAVTSGSSAGADGPAGSLVALNGETRVRATASIAVPKVASTTLSASTVPYKEDVVISDGSKYFSAVYRWSYPGIAARVYHGYGVNTAQYSQTIQIVDIAYLIQLISECDALTSLNYTASSWSALNNALRNAKNEMDYANMDADAIVAECTSRYQALLSAKNNLVEAASNTVIDNAISAANEIKANGKTYTSSTKTIFDSALQNAIDAIKGTYSDDNCLDLTKKDNQAAIDAIATELTDAIAALKEAANFANLAKAISDVKTLEDNTYTVDSLKAIKAAVEAATYYALTSAEKADTPATAQSAIDAQTKAVTDAYNARKQGADISALAAFDIKNSDIDNFDAIDVQKAEAYVQQQAASFTEKVSILDLELTGLADGIDQNAIDEVITNALSNFKKYYKIMVNGEEYTAGDNYDSANGGYLYGSEVTVQFDSESDIFYAYDSNATETYKDDFVKKYFTTDKVIHFVIKGNTYLSAYPVESSSEEKTQYTVKFVRSTDNSVVDVVTVDATESTVAVPEVKGIAYHEFNGYKIGDNTYSKDTTSLPVSGDMTVVLQYDKVDASVPTYTVSYTNFDDFVVVNNTVSYNDKVELSYEGARYWVAFDNEEDFNTWLDGAADVTSPIEHVVWYGETYTFRAHEDVWLAALDDAALDYDADNGYIDMSEIDKPAVWLDENPVYASTKVSFISTFKLNEEKYTFVEAGVLLALDGNTDIQKLSDAETNSNIYRLKSSQHTTGNQFVISLSTKNMPDKQGLSVLPYMIYKDETGKEKIVYGKETFKPVIDKANN